MAANGTDRPARIVFGAETRKLRRDLAAAKGEIRGFGKDTAHSIRSSIGTAFAGAFSLASLGGAVSVVKDVVANERALTRLGIQAEVSDERVRALATNIGQISNDTGQFTSELIAGATQIVTLTGDFDLAERSVRALGVAATATGATMGDLAGVSASLGESLHIDGKGMGKALDALTVQGKKGKIELKDLASLLPTASAQFARFGEKGMTAVTTLGAGLQTVARATGTPAEAATAFNALGKAYEANAKRIKKYTGVNVKRKDGSTRDFAEITDDLRRAKLRNGATSSFDFLGTDEAVKGFEALRANWEDFQGLITAGMQGGGTIEADFKRYLESPAGRIERSWTRAGNALQRAVTPERVELIADATEKFARALGFVVDHGVHMVALIGAAKLGQFSLATSKWATTMSGVASSTAQVSGAIGRGAAGLTGMASGTTRLVGGLSQAVGHAGGIASAFTASFAATSMLVDALGLFEDKYKAVATADDPRAKAAEAQRMLEQTETTRNEAAKQVVEYQAQLERARGPGNATWQTPAAIADTEAKLRAAQAQLAHEDQELSGRRAAVTAATVGERDSARGTDSLKYITDNLRTKQALDAGLGRLGSLAPEVDMEALKQYAPEAQGLSGELLGRVVSLLEAQLQEQERLRALQERVRGPGVGPGEEPAMISAPRTGTSPR
jgi:hypothetical protein